MIDKLVFEKVQVDKGKYFAEYEPPKSNRGFATLSLTYLNEVALEDAVSELEAESNDWITQYPVPIQAFAFDNTGSMLEISQIRVSSCLVSWPEDKASEIAKSWEINDLTQFLEKNNKKLDLKSIYSDIPYRNASDVNVNNLEYVTQQRKQRRVLRIILVLWIVIPAVWATIAYLNPELLSPLLNLVGLVSFLIVVISAARRTLRALGCLKPSASETKKRAEELQKNHHHYHCLQNPLGFERLKAENLDKELRLKTIEEAKNLKDPRK